MKRTALRKKSKAKISTLKRKLWSEVSEYIRKRDKFTCFTCGRKGEGSAMHAGHFIPDAVCGILLRYDEFNINAQCFHCNINLGGWGERYAERMEQKYGREFVDELRKKIHTLTKWTEQDYEEKIEYYKQKIKDLQ